MSDFLDPDLIQYGVYIDNETVITKNNKILQTIAIRTNVLSHDSFRENVRNAINSQDLTDIAVYIHTVKLSEKTDTISYDSLSRFEDEIINNIAKASKLTELQEISFYITFVKNIIAKPSLNIESTFTHKSFFQQHNKQTKKAIENINDITRNILSDLKEYRAYKLQIRNRNEVYYSEHAEFLSKLINLTNESIPIDTQNIAQQVNKSHYKFGKNVYKITNEQGSKYGEIFTLKGYSEIATKSIYTMLQNVKNIIISQTCIPIDNTILLKEYNEIAKIYAASPDEEFKNSSALIYMNALLESNGKDNVFAKSQLNIIVISDELDTLHQESKIVLSIFNQAGIVAFSEDAHLQNSLFSIIPGNFRFLARLSNIPIPLIGGFAYSQGSSRLSNQAFMWNKSLFICQKFQNSQRFDFGIPKEQRDIFLYSKNDTTAKLTPVIFALGALKNDVNTIIIDASCQFDSAMYVSGLQLAKTSVEYNDIAYKKLNPFAGLDSAESNTSQYVRLILNLMSSVALHLSADDMQSIINEIIESKGGQFQNLVRKYNLTTHFKEYVSGGKYYSIFDYNISEDDLSIGKSVKISLPINTNDEKFIDLIKLISIFRISKIIEHNKNLLVIFNDCMQYFNTEFDTQLLSSLLVFTKKSNNISVIFSSSQELSSISKLQSMQLALDYCENKILFGVDGNDHTDEYKSIFNLTENEISALKSMYETSANAFYFKNPYYNESLLLNTSELGDNLRILNDSGMHTMEKLTSFIQQTQDRRLMYHALLEAVSLQYDESDQEGSEGGD